MVAGADLVSRMMFTEQEKDACLVPDARLGLRYKPDCTATLKSFESPWVTDHYNDCGFRTDAPCGPVPRGVRRVALLGSSLAMGYLVPEQDTFAARSAKALTRLCGAPVEVQDLGGYLVFWTRILNRVDDALKLKPDAALLQVSTMDLERPDPGEGAVGANEGEPPTTNLLLKIKDLLGQSRAWQVVQHYLFQKEDLYLSLYLNSGSKSAYLREPLSPFWEGKLRAYDVMLGKIADKFHAAGVPLALVYVPQRAQAIVASKEPGMPGLYPYQLDQRLAAIAASHHVAFIDTTPAVARAPKITDLFYPVDGHLDGEGHTVITSAIVDGIVAEPAAVPRLPPGLEFDFSRQEREPSALRALARSDPKTPATYPAAGSWCRPCAPARVFAAPGQAPRRPR